MIEKAESARQKKSHKKTIRTPGLRIDSYFAKSGRDPFDEIEWELRSAAITGEDGKVYFEQKNVEAPKSWSQMATNIVVQKYFRGIVGTPERETSVKQLINRVADTITGWGSEQGYFATPADADYFRNELKHLLVHQKMAFNSPVWFNVGVETHPQCSACFINSVEDTMESILDLAKTEGMLFKWGSGTGTNMSTLRSSRENLSKGGIASGPVSFMKGFDAFAGVIKSGGKTRRAAKMVILNADHPDVEEFVVCKVKEEKKAHALIDAGYDGSFTGEAYSSVFFQNSNNSVRVTDEFMEAVVADRKWTTRSVKDGKEVDTFPARKLWKSIVEAAHQCGDPGLQFDTTVNDWHTSPVSGRINASNPCSEYMFLDNSACNLASLNLRKFQDPLTGELDIESFTRAVDMTILAQEILVDNSKYPTQQITENSYAFRPLGLGYANLGALLMSRGLPYDSAPGRAYASAVTALMHGRANYMSAVISRDVTGPFSGYVPNREPFLRVMKKHREATKKIDRDFVPFELCEAVNDTWSDVIVVGEEYGFRNAQVTVLAPTGTIGFMMDCDTTGIEPDIALVKYKRLVGGGMLKIVNQTVPEALDKLGYTASEKAEILKYIDANDTIEGSPTLRLEHLAVFDCAFRPRNGIRSISPMGHINMMAAAQPFLSGAISKTVNLPNEATIQDVENAYMEAWRLGLKAIAIYRDGCKRSQPVSTAAKSNTDGTISPTVAPAPVAPPVTKNVAVRRKLPDERESVTHKFSIAGHDGYITVGKYEDGTPGEMFIRMAKEGSTVAGLMDSFATVASIALQHGVPLHLLVDKLSRTRFDPAGYTGNPDIPRASSIMDYIFRWLGKKFVPAEPMAVETYSSPGEVVEMKALPANGSSSESASWRLEADAPTCHACGSIMVRNGSCHRCMNCGETSGCS